MKRRHGGTSTVRFDVVGGTFRQRLGTAMAGPEAQRYARKLRQYGVPVEVWVVHGGRA